MKKITLLLGALILSGCSSPEPITPQPPRVIGTPNPASVYCKDKGGELRVVKTDLGERGDCILPGGERIDEWKLYRRDH
ncbi:putative hemolysin [Dryocola sp. BD586]|uniref:putative hemolysin n=1 Tax=Dryocola sp. BD586 TaxID=3133271 RepID=UPI003F5005BB